MSEKNITYCLIILAVLFFVNTVFAQNYADKDYYLVDSLELGNLVVSEKELLQSSLTKFHNTENQELKLQAINIIVENSWDDNLWHKYNQWLHNYTKHELHSIIPITNNQDLNSEEKLLLKFYSYSLNNIGIIFNDKGDLSKALRYYYKSLEIREQINDRAGMSESYINIGGIYDSQGSIDKAIEFTKKGLQFSVKGFNSQSVTTALNNLGVYYNRKENVDKALEYHEKALKRGQEYGDKVSIANTLGFMADIYADEGNLDKGLFFFKKSLKVLEDNGHESGQNIVLTKMAKAYLKKGDLLHARKFAEKSLKVANKFGDPELIMITSENLGEIYKKSQNWKKVLEMQTLYFKMRDSIQNNEIERSLIKQKSKYDIEKKQQKIEILSTKNEIQELKLSKNKNSIILISIALLLALATAFVSFRGYKKKQYINKLLERQKAEISLKNEAKKTMLQEIHHRVKNNLQVVNSLLRMQSSKLEDENIVDMFKETQSRVRSMAKLHEKMYQSGDLEKLNAMEHLTMLVKEIVKNYSVGIPIDLNLDIDAVFIDAQTMMPLSLIINEIITNSLKYAFKGRERGLITVKLNKLEKVNELIIADNGVGYTPNDESTGLGSRLIESFTRQLNGTMERITGSGTVFKLVFEN